MHRDFILQTLYRQFNSACKSIKLKDMTATVGVPRQAQDSSPKESPVIDLSSRDCACFTDVWNWRIGMEDAQ